ncbi:MULTISPECIES: hypothetical protein [Microbacterium]|uniref:Membrane-anchored glycerophosphoryl diester phosphodiesterase (GDPDase), membrane domain n=1 Tax=Microbacterium saccharophilum TaxID=1213358 RepID=A0A7Z7CYP2_9MICO|nr:MULTISPECIES: hypothetical protein [Microbacterium]SFI63793.1 Membrane-anchored glycerophosphoryl diester phosphodiesterase (GDPDase), membrane domain [Microbacterium saccharophilum]
MTAYPTWTPAPPPGIIPLRPLGFGTILGRSFAALRQNPRVLLGFALVAQTVVTIVAAAGIVATGFYAFGRVATLEPGDDDFDTVMAGSIALVGVVSVLLGLATTAFSVLVQAVIVREVAHAALAERLTLGGLWRQVKPVAGRLIGYTVLLSLAVAVLVGILVAGFVLLAQASVAAVIVVVLLAIMVTVPVSLWLSVKLLLVPAVIVMEQARILEAVRRSWLLTRGRFWPSLGIIVIISSAFGVLAQLVTLPMSFLTTGLTTVLSPTGDPEVGGVIALLVGLLVTEVLVVLLQSVALVVQSTATALIYIDCRMRREGLDLDLLAYVDQRDLPGAEPGDPYRAHVGRDLPRWAPPVRGTAVPGFGGPAAPHPAPGYPPTAPAPAPAPPASVPAPAPSPTTWTPPGGAPGTL